MSNGKQMTIQEQKDLVRFELIDNIFTALGLCSEWVLIDRVQEGLSYVLEKRQMIENSLPVKIVIPKKDSNMWESWENNPTCVTSRRHLLAFARRLAGYRYFVIVRKSHKIRLNRDKTREDLFYKLLRNY